MCHAIYERYNFLILEDYLHFWDGKIGRVCKGRPTKEGTKKDSLSQFLEAHSRDPFPDADKKGRHKFAEKAVVT
jgi:hypothetical protein